MDHTGYPNCENAMTLLELISAKRTSPVSEAPLVRRFDLDAPQRKSHRKIGYAMRATNATFTSPTWGM